MTENNTSEAQDQEDQSVMPGLGGFTPDIEGGNNPDEANDANEAAGAAEEAAEETNATETAAEEKPVEEGADIALETAVAEIIADTGAEDPQQADIEAKIAVIDKEVNQAKSDAVALSNAADFLQNAIKNGGIPDSLSDKQSKMLDGIIEFVGSNIDSETDIEDIRAARELIVERRIESNHTAISKEEKKHTERRIFNQSRDFASRELRNRAEAAYVESGAVPGSVLRDLAKGLAGNAVQKIQANGKPNVLNNPTAVEKIIRAACTEAQAKLDNTTGTAIKKARANWEQRTIRKNEDNVPTDIGGGGDIGSGGHPLGIPYGDWAGN